MDFELCVLGLKYDVAILQPYVVALDRWYILGRFLDILFCFISVGPTPFMHIEAPARVGRGEREGKACQGRVGVVRGQPHEHVEKLSATVEVWRLVGIMGGGWGSTVDATMNEEKEKQKCIPSSRLERLTSSLLVTRSTN